MTRPRASNDGGSLGRPSPHQLRPVQLARLEREHARLAKVAREEHFVGDRYDPARPLGDTSRAIRRDLGELARTRGPLEGCRFDVRVASRTSIRIEVTPPPGVSVTHLGRARDEADRPHSPTRHPRWNTRGAAILKAVEAAANRYRYDRSDIQSDYHDTAWHLTVGYSEGIEAAEWSAVKAAMKAAGTWRKGAR